MEWVETTGRSVQEAMDRALDILGVDDTDADFEVLEEPRPGLFGRMRGEARVRARVRPSAPRPKADRRRKRKTESSTTSEGGDMSEVTAAAAGGTQVPTSTQESTAPASREPRESRPVAETSAIAAESEAFLSGLLEAFGVSAGVEIDVSEDEVEARVEGEDLGLLIGPRGQTLTALQDVTRMVVQRRAGPGGPRLVVDVAGYRRRRREALARFAEQVAHEVATTGQAKSLEPMSAADRKVIHDALTDVEGVSTSSEGDEPHRRVIVTPVG